MKFWKASIVTLEHIDVVENVVLEKWWTPSGPWFIKIKKTIKNILVILFQLFGAFSDDVNLLIQPKFHTHNLLEKRACYIPLVKLLVMVFVVFKTTHMETLVNNIDNEIIVIAINNGVYLTPKKIMRRFSL